MGKKPPQGLPEDVRQKKDMRLTKPPRLEGVVHSASIRTKKKKKKA